VQLRHVDDLLSLTVSEPADAQAVSALLRSMGLWLDVVPGMDSVVVRFDLTRMDATTAMQTVQDALAEGIPAMPSSAEVVEIPIVYGGQYGPDLDDLCGKLDLGADEFIALHSRGEHRVDLVGFTPGFAFIGGLDERLHVPRRDKPRQHVAAGSVGIAGAYTGLYPLPSPGGWTLIGRTPQTLFDPRAAEPFALRAGTVVRFRPVSAKEAGFDS
jgi:inhibitor of KinA